MSRLEDAMGRALDRKNAAFNASGEGVSMADESTVALMFSGFDLDIAELCRVGAFVGRVMLQVLEKGGPEAILTGAWLDGLLTGMFLAGDQEHEHELIFAALFPSDARLPMHDDQEPAPVELEVGSEEWSRHVLDRVREGRQT